MTNYYRQSLSDSLTTDATTTQSSGRFDVLREARWHRLKFDFTGSVELNMYDADLIPRKHWKPLLEKLERGIQGEPAAVVEIGATVDVEQVAFAAPYLLLVVEVQKLDGVAV